MVADRERHRAGARYRVRPCPRRGGSGASSATCSSGSGPSGTSTRSSPRRWSCSSTKRWPPGSIRRRRAAGRGSSSAGSTRSRRPSGRRGPARLLETLVQDARYAVRMLARSPGFSAVAIATLALGIGANSAIYTVLEAALIAPLPYAEPSRLVMLWTDFRESKQPRVPASGHEMLEIRQPEPPAPGGRGHLGRRGFGDGGGRPRAGAGRADHLELLRRAGRRSAARPDLRRGGGRPRGGPRDRPLRCVLAAALRRRPADPRPGRAPRRRSRDGRRASCRRAST